jgi:hypothetical protein
MKLNNIKLMEFLKNCDINAGPSNYMCMKNSSYKEADTVLHQWFNQKQAEGSPVSGPLSAQKIKFFS